MKPVLIIKTVNGYAIVEYSGDIPQTDLRSMNVATTITGSWSGGSSVVDILKNHFEPPKASTENA